MLRQIVRNIVLIFFVIPLILSQENPDIVKDLPDYPYKGTFYSGYLEIDNNIRKIHYVFIEAETDKENKPLIIWLNGGPGCSSLIGFIQENGPAVFDENEKLKINDYGWQKQGNLLYLETPAGVGFSIINSTKPDDWKVDDEKSAVQHMEALKKFYEKYPGYLSHKLFISGESYAGIYIPRLAKKIIEYNKDQPEESKIQLEGILVGNGITSWDYDSTAAQYDYAFSHYLVSYDYKMQFNEVCIKHYDESKCNELKEKLETEFTKDLNVYDILRDCYIENRDEMSEEELKKSYYYNYAKWAFPHINKNKKGEKRRLKQEKQCVSKNVRSEYVPPCTDPRAPRNYFNNKTVKNALHVADIKWESCVNEVHGNYTIDKKGVLDIYKEILLTNNIRILIFNGDTDFVVPFLGNQRWINSLNLPIVNKTISWRYPNDLEHVAGYRTVYSGLIFTTLKGTGHFSVQYRSRDAFYMLQQFILGQDF